MPETTAPLKRGNWTDNPCFYVSVIDGAKYALVARPFRPMSKRLSIVEQAKKVGYTRIPCLTSTPGEPVRRPTAIRKAH